MESKKQNRPATGDAPSSGSARSQAAEWTEDEALALLEQPQVDSVLLVELGRNPATIRSRKVTLALAMHPRTPQRVSLSALKRLFTFDLVAVTRAARAPARVKRAAEEEILKRIEALSLGEKLALARRASPRVSERLLVEPDTRIIDIALNSPRLNESSLTRALMSANAPCQLFERASEHPKWSLRQEVSLALLRSEKTPLEHAVRLASAFSADRLSELVPPSRRSRLLEAARPW